MTWGLLLTSLGLGLRHGFDWDHIAAIGDLSGSAGTRRRGLWLSFLYAVGHAAVVFALGALAIVFGLTLPQSVDRWLGPIVGLTLVALGLWVLVGLARQGRDFRLRSRWMLVLGGTFAGMRRVRQSRSGRTIVLDHDHSHEHVDHVDAAHDDAMAHDHAHVGLAEPADVSAEPSELVDARAGVTPARPARNWWGRHSHDSGHRHQHTHRHEMALSDEATPGSGVATGIGMLHGIGVESPTQIAIFVASTAAVGASTGLVLLAAWVIGLVAANTLLAVAAGFGLLGAERHFAIYATIAVLVGVGSLFMGVLLIGGIDVLPELS